jgi:D-3-phosphoglycerate dehydrogenase
LWTKKPWLICWKAVIIRAAAFDVFAVEPAKENVLFGKKNFIATPHLGAATAEAQENVALQVAEQMSDYLLSGAVTNALNMPSITAEEAPRIKPFADVGGKAWLVRRPDLRLWLRRGCHRV